MGIGCVYPNRGAMATPANLVRFAQTAEALGFDTIWTSDHIVVPTEGNRSTPTIPPARCRLSPQSRIWSP